MTSKERAALRAQANTIEPLFQVGKGGISQALIDQTKDALKKRELIKLKVLLDTAPEAPNELAHQIADATGSEVVQVIGGSMIFYKLNPELHENEKKAKPKAMASARSAAPKKQSASSGKRRSQPGVKRSSGRREAPKAPYARRGSARANGSKG